MIRDFGVANETEISLFKLEDYKVELTYLDQFVIC